MIEYEEHPTDYLAELALGVLVGDDRALALAHVDGCDLCRGESEELARVAAMLPLAAEEVVPPPGLRQELLDRVRAGGEATSSRVATRRVPRLWSLVAVAAGIGLVAILGGVLGYLVGPRQQDDSERIAASGGMTLLSAAARGTLVMDRGGEGGTRAVVLRAPGTTAAFAWLESPPALPPGKAYQAWFTKDGVLFEPSNVFTANGGVWLEAPGRMEEYAAMGFTIEDDGGAASPSQAPFVTVGLGKLALAR